MRKSSLGNTKTQFNIPKEGHTKLVVEAVWCEVNSPEREGRRFERLPATCYRSETIEKKEKNNLESFRGGYGDRGEARLVYSISLK